MLFSSRLIEVLEFILEEPKTKKEIEKTLKISTSHLAQVLSKMVDMGLVDKRGDIVKILPKGEFILGVNRVAKGYDEFLSRFGNFMNTYILDDIPEWLISRFYELAEIEIAERREDVFSPHPEFFEHLSNSKRIYGYVTVFFKECINFFLRLAEEGREMEIIVNKGVLDKIVENFTEGFGKGIERKNVRFYVSKKDFQVFFYCYRCFLFDILLFKKCFFLTTRKIFFANLGWVIVPNSKSFIKAIKKYAPDKLEEVIK